VLGAVVERAMDASLPEVIKKYVTGPLGMAQTLFDAPDPEQLAVPYADGMPPVRMEESQMVPFFGLGGLRFSPSRIFDPRSFPSGGAGMRGTAADVARLLETVRTGEGVLRRESARSMMTNQTGTLETVMGPGYGFGYGGAVLLDPRAAKTPQSAGTWSWGGVYGHAWFVDPVRQLVVVGLTNTAIEGMMGRFPVALRDALYVGLRRANPSSSS
jgi:CubicO group peptidase (beta-lactamase class C family)